MKRQEVGRQRHVFGPVHRVELGRGELRIVRLRRRHVQEQRLPAGALADEGDQVVRVSLGGLTVQVTVEVHVHGTGIVAKLAAANRGVARRLDGLRPGGRRPPHVQIALARLDHGAARQTHGPDVRALGVGATESEPLLDEFVEVRRFHDRVAQGMQAVGPQVVGQDEKHIGPRSRGRGLCRLETRGCRQHGDPRGKASN